MLVAKKRFWTGEQKSTSPCYDWDDHKIRRECIEGTRREWGAYIATGHIQLIAPVAKDATLEEEVALSVLANEWGPRTSCQEVAEAIAGKYGVTVEDMRNIGRTQKVVDARTEFCKVCILTLKKKQSVVAKYLHRDRTTIRHYIKQALT